MLILFEPACRYVWEPFQVFNVEFDPYFDPNSDINDLKIGPNPKLKTQIMAADMKLRLA